jgi:hypothetical protein
MRVLLAIALLVTLAPQAPDRGPDAALIARWAKASVVHYQMVGVYEGATVIADREPAGTATVTDRVELTLDWDLKAGALVGAATFVNTPSQTRELRNIDRSCPAPTPDGAYEHLTVAGVAGVSGSLELSGTRTFPSVRVVAGCLGVQEPKTVRAWQQDVVERVVVPSPLLLMAPAGSDPNLTVSADRTSFTVKNGAWAWTFTPTLVR